MRSRMTKDGGCCADDTCVDAVGVGYIPRGVYNKAATKDGASFLNLLGPSSNHLGKCLGRTLKKK